MKRHGVEGGGEVKIILSSISALKKEKNVGGQSHSPAALHVAENSVTHCKRGRVVGGDLRGGGGGGEENSPTCFRKPTRLFLCNWSQLVNIY
jgi:hypothetical protein